MQAKYLRARTFFFPFTTCNNEVSFSLIPVSQENATAETAACKLCHGGRKRRTPASLSNDAAQPSLRYPAVVATAKLDLLFRGSLDDRIGKLLEGEGETRKKREGDGFGTNSRVWGAKSCVAIRGCKVRPVQLQGPSVTCSEDCAAVGPFHLSTCLAGPR